MSEVASDHVDRVQLMKDSIAHALRRSDEELSKPEDLSELVFSNSTGLAKPSKAWMWEGYVLKGKLTSIEAKGGGGKSRLLLGIAACLSNGVFPFSYESEIVNVEPGRILYFSTEDTMEESAQTFEECGGNRELFFPYNRRKYGALRLNDQGLTNLEKMIKANRIVMTAFDPILQYLPDSVKSQNDNVSITQFLDDLRAVAESTNTALFTVRHWAKGTLGKDVEDLAAGGEAWRNGARGQFVMFPHPKNMNNWSQFLVVPGRNTQRVQYGKPFAIEVRTGYQTFVHPKNIDWETYIEAYPALAKRYGSPKASFNRSSRGPAPKARQAAAQAILDLLTKRNCRSMYCKDVINQLEGNGDGLFSRATLYLAKKALNDQGLLTDTRGLWQVTEAYDPLDDDFQLFAQAQEGED